jgi:hypothetical protein
MTPAERDREVAKFDAGIPFEKTRELTAAERARWERARGGKSRAQSGEGEGVPVIVRIDPKVLARAHADARRNGKTLSQFISELLAQRKPGRRAS